MDKKINIRKYRKNLKNWKVIVATFVISGIVAWLFYRSFLGMLLMPVIYALCVYYFTEEEQIKRRDKVLLEFKDMLGIICNGLKAGHSLENVMIELEKDFENLYSNKAITMYGIIHMRKQLQMKKPVEQVIGEFAKIYDYEEINSFAYMIGFAKRLGGNYIKNISSAADKLQGRLEIKQEISTMLTEKKLEMRIMGVMPLGILIYIGVTSFEFIEPLYGNIAGVCIMTVCLIAYVFCLYIGKRIVTIDW